ncbi:MAG: sulfite exporter TauE/SafE family protein [Clostridia bacterium]|nr:sulfite exporter TauE/SafE family protein [Clostridia bacterium]
MTNIIVGFFSGIISGMGIGGGAILIPALILLQGIGQQVAQGINLLYFLPTAIVSLIVHIKNKNVELKTALILGISGVLGAIGGSLLAVRMSGGLLGRLFGIFLFLIGVYEVYKGIKMRKDDRKGRP